jgi:hypothetical protein
MATKPKRKLIAKRLESPDLPKYCDFTCPHASFAPRDVVGDCRREMAVYCDLLATYNNKNAHCAVREDRLG